MRRHAFALLIILGISAHADAATVADQVKQLQRTEKQLSAAVQAGDAQELRRIDGAFTSQLQALLSSDAPFECAMAGNAMQGLLISLMLPTSARKLSALDHDAGQWERNMDACEHQLHLKSKRYITR